MIARRAFLAAALALGSVRLARAQTTFSDQEMRAFAGATLDLQSLGSQDPQAMTHVIQAAGMSVEQYNRMGDAMRNDPSLADRLNPYLDSARDARIGRSSGATSYDPSRSAPYDPSPRRARTSRTRTSSRKKTRSTRGRKRTTAKGRKGRVTTKTRRHATTSKKRATSHGKTKKKAVARKKHRSA